MSISGLWPDEEDPQTPIQESLDRIKAEKPSLFTVGGTYDGKKIQGGLTYDRTWKTGWGLTAYAKAWWDDLPVSTHTPKKKLGGEIGVNVVKKF